MAKKLAFDKLLFGTVLLLVGFGLVMVYSASAAIARESGATWNPFLVKQTLAAALGLLLMLAVMHLDYRKLREPWLVYLLLAGCLALLVAVLFAPALNNTHRWIFLAGVSLQPSELAKLGLVVFLAYQLERKPDRVNRPELLVPALGAAGLCALLVLLEPHLSAALVLCGVTCLLLFLAGLSWRAIGLALGAVVPLLALAVWLVPYRRERFLTYLDPERDPLGSGFQAVQSLIAVGSGGVIGQGLGHGAQKLYFLPYPHTDFIFAIVAEEFGLIGAVGMILLFVLLGLIGIRAAMRAPDALGMLLAAGVTSWFVVQAFVNIGAVIGVLPITGVPLPFVSFGGSSLVVTMAAPGIILNIARQSRPA